MNAHIKSLQILSAPVNNDLQQINDLAFMSTFDIVYKNYQQTYTNNTLINEHVDLAKGITDQAFINSTLLDYLNQSYNKVTNIKAARHKSFLISTLVSASNYDALIAVLKQTGADLAHLFQSAQVSEPDCWQIKILRSQTRPWQLVNLFVTNNDEPQFVYLGKSLYALNVTGSSVIIGIAENDTLLKFNYQYNTENPAKVYQSQLINLDKSVDMTQIITDLNQQYQTVIAQLPTKKDKSMFSPQTIIYLDLNFLMQQLSMQTYLPDDFPKHPEIMAILHLLAEKL